jgi:hypothetical protein
VADYHDRFSAPLLSGRTPEQVARAAFEGTPLYGAIRLIHRHVLRFHLAPRHAAGHIGGWRIEESDDHLVRVSAHGALFNGRIEGRTQADVVTLTTTLDYRTRRARAVWSVIGPLHRFLAPRLLRRGAGSSR